MVLTTFLLMFGITACSHRFNGIFKKTQKLDFIFPAGFTGYTIVVNHQKCGQKVVVKDKREQLFIPQNGILLYNGSVKPGLVDHRYFYRIKPDSLIPIPELAMYKFYLDSNNLPPNQITGVWLGGMGTKSVFVPKPAIEYTYMTLFVDSKDSFEVHHSFFSEKYFEELTDSLVRDCKMK
jgi:hypothetical protein